MKCGKNDNCPLVKVAEELEKANQDMNELCKPDNCIKDVMRPDLLSQRYEIQDMTFKATNTTTIIFGRFSKEMDVTEEYYLIELSGLFSAIGGDLGLIIGAGLLTLFESIIDICHETSIARVR